MTGHKDGHDRHLTAPGTAEGLLSGPGGHKKTKRLGLFGNVWATLVMAIVVFAGIGGYLLYTSHADATQVTCNSIGSGKYNCNFYQLTPVRDSNNAQVGTLHVGTNWVICQSYGGPLTNNGHKNAWWAWTTADNNKNGWVNAIYGVGGLDSVSATSPVGSFQSVPACGKDKPAPPLVGKVASTPDIIPYTGGNDGCGGNAEHYDAGKTIHVGQNGYGTGSVCKCTYAAATTYVNYPATPYQNATRNPSCAAAPATSSSSGSSSTGSSSSAGSSSSQSAGDGCGGSASHYISASNRTHLASTSATGVCVCDNGVSFKYGFKADGVTKDPNSPYPNSKDDPTCATLKALQDTTSASTKALQGAISAGSKASSGSAASNLAALSAAASKEAQALVKAQAAAKAKACGTVPSTASASYNTKTGKCTITCSGSQTFNATTRTCSGVVNARGTCSSKVAGAVQVTSLGAIKVYLCSYVSGTGSILQLRPANTACIGAPFTGTTGKLDCHVSA